MHLGFYKGEHILLDLGLYPGSMGEKGTHSCASPYTKIGLVSWLWHIRILQCSRILHVRMVWPKGVAQRCGYGAWPQPWPSPTTTHDEKMGEVSSRPWSLKQIVMFTLLCYGINTWKITYFVKVTDVWERHATKHIYFMLEISPIWWMRIYIYMPMHY